MNLKAIPAMLSMIPSALSGVALDDLEKIEEITRRAYPGVARISTRQLADCLSDADHPHLLVDVRSAEEFAVSHLRGSLHLPTAADVSRALSQRQPETVVLYCSVGFRSARLAHQLAASHPGLLNLEGSIFRWANEGHPIFRGDQKVTQVHPYSQRWAGLLKPGLAISLSPS